MEFPGLSPKEVIAVLDERVGKRVVGVFVWLVFVVFVVACVTYLVGVLKPAVIATSAVVEAVAASRPIQVPTLDWGAVAIAVVLVGAVVWWLARYAKRVGEELSWVQRELVEARQQLQSVRELDENMKRQLWRVHERFKFVEFNSASLRSVRNLEDRVVVLEARVLPVHEKAPTGVADALMQQLGHESQIEATGSYVAVEQDKRQD
jgi:hypothetical protein